MLDTITTIATPVASIATTTGVLEVAQQQSTVKNAIIAVLVYVIQRGLLKLWDKLNTRKPKII